MDQRPIKAALLLACLSLAFQNGIGQSCQPPKQYNGYCSYDFQCCSGVCIRQQPGDYYMSCTLPDVTPDCAIGRFKCRNPVTGVTGCCDQANEVCCQKN